MVIYIQYTILGGLIMCGIVGYIGYRNAGEVLLDGLLKLEYRGYDSAGMSIIKDSSILTLKNKGRVSNLVNLYQKNSIHSNIGIAHTRWATHGKPSDDNSHPHLDNSKCFSVVHNGIIENHLEIKQFLKNENYNFLSETDTEVIPNLIHYYFSKTKMKEITDVLSAIKTAIDKLEGSFAIEVLCNLFPDYIIALRKDSPLVIGKDIDENFIASDIPAILSYTNNFYLLDDLEIALISKNDVIFFDSNLNHISKKITVIDLDASSVQKNGFADFMLKEIYEQPTSVRETIGTLLNDKNISFPDLSLKKDLLNSISHIYIVACGTAWHAGLGVKPLLEHLSNIPVSVEIASEFRYNNPILSSSTLCIFVSQSGETADTIAALKLAKSKGATTIVITNVIGSSITREAHYSLYTHAGPEIAVASTKAYTAQLTLLSLLSIYIAEVLGYDNTKLLSELKSDIKSLPHKLEQVLETNFLIQKISNDIFKEKDIFFLGRGIDYTTALEGSLKLKEITYIHSEAYPSGELKHGPIALIDTNVPVISIITDEKISQKTLSNVQEVISRGAKSIIVSSLDEDFNSHCNYLIKIPDINNYLSAILTIVPLQLLAYNVSKNKGIDVDKPRNLAKSVTVE